MSYTIIVDSFCDVTDEMNTWEELKVVNEKSKNGVSNLPFAYLEAIKDSGDDVYIVTASNRLTNSYHYALSAKKMYCEAPDTKSKNICVFNSYGIGPVETIAAMKIRSLAEDGANFLSVQVLGKYYLANKTEFFVYSQNGKSLFSGELSDTVQGVTPPMKRVNILIKKSIDGAFVATAGAFTRKAMLQRLEREVSSVALKYDTEEKTAVISYLVGCEDEAKALQNTLSRLNINKILLTPCKNADDVFSGKNALFVAMAV